MPLGPAGREVKGKLQDRYGAEKGKSVLYAKMNKQPRFEKAMHKGASSRKLGRR